MKFKVSTRKILTSFAVFVALFSSCQSRIVPDAIVGSTCELPNNAGSSTCQFYDKCPSLARQHLKTTNKLTNEDVEFMSSLKCSKTRPLFCCPPIIATYVDFSAVPEHPKPLNVTEILNHRNIGLINNKKCGSTANSRILIGTKNKAGDYPWMALLQYKNKGSRAFKCGGSLISEYYVLTAAHCIHKDLVAVRLGEHNILTYEDKLGHEKASFTVQDIEIESKVAYPKYNEKLKLNDVGLIRMKSAAILEKTNIGTICLPVEEENQFEVLDDLDEEIRNHLIVAGWGISKDGANSDILIKGRRAYVDVETCKTQLTGFTVFDSWLCAGGKTRAGTCYEDLGGPLFAPSIVRTRFRMTQYGVVSEGISCGDETDSLPGIYMHIKYYIKWILDNMTNE